ncbi:MAG: hypothetical protein Q4F69_11815, partial [Bacteroidia bacterium]|nr:hypothetical protein [Bacteroidia bacterium]
PFCMCPFSLQIFGKYTNIYLIIKEFYLEMPFSDSILTSGRPFCAFSQFNINPVKITNLWHNIIFCKSAYKIFNVSYFQTILLLRRKYFENRDEMDTISLGVRQPLSTL